GINPTSQVSMGSVGNERLVTNVAAGALSADSTDAVNGSQLFATNSAINSLNSSITNLDTGSVKYDTNIDGSVNYNSVTLGGDTYDNSTHTGGTKITNVADGTAPSDAVNFSQLTETNNSVNDLSTTVNNFAGDQSDTYTTINGRGIRYVRTNDTGLTQEDAFATGQGSTAVGYNAVSGGINSLALGNNASASIDDGVALGSRSVASTAAGVAGWDPDTFYMSTSTSPVWRSSLSAVSVGDPVNGLTRQITGVAAGAEDSDAVNVAQLKASMAHYYSFNDNGVNIANYNDDGATGFNSIAAGVGAQASGTNAVSTGVMAQANGTNSLSIGYGTVVNGDRSGAFGDPTIINGADSYSFGNENYIDSNNVFVMGNNVNVGTGFDGAVVLGNDSTVSSAVATPGTTINDVAYSFAGVNPTSVVSVGAAGAERQVTNVAAGQITATSTDAINGSQLFATNSAIDNLSGSVTNLDAGSVKYDTNIDGTVNYNSVTLGGDTYDNSTHTGGTKITNVADGTAPSDAVNFSQLTETNSQINNIYNTGTKYFHANSTGADSQALGSDAVAIGMGAVANNAGDVALGAGSVTGATSGTAGATIAGTDYVFAGVNPTSQVSVGSVGNERLVTNVAAGALSADSTDAVNGSQLFATNSAINSLNSSVTSLDAGSVKYDTNIDGTVNYNSITLGGDTYDNSTHSGGTTITNVADGTAPSDAVNFSQLTETNNQINNIYNTGTKYFHANSTGADSQALGQDAVAIGMGAVANNAGDVALGAGSVTGATSGTAGTTIAGTDYAFAGINPTSQVSMGSVGNERLVTNVAAGALAADSTDAVNGSQLFATNTAINSINTDITGLQQDALLWDPAVNAFSAKHGSVTVNKITNVAAGELSETSTDAVNGSQLYATNQQVNNIDGRVTNIENVVYDNVVPTMRYLKVNSTGTDAVASGSNAVALGQATVASGDNSIATGNGAQSSGDGAIATGANSSASGATSVAMGQNASAVADNSVALGAGSVADRANTVSVGSAGNERQITNVAAGTAATDAVNVSQLQQATGDIVNIQNTVTNISDGQDGMFQVNNTSSLPKPAPTGYDAIAGGAGAHAKGNNSMAIGTNSASLADNSVALGNGASASASNSVALGTGSIADRQNTISVGSVGSERQITNVGPGTSGTDAVNVNQLKQGISSANQYTNNQFNSLKNMVEKQDDKLKGGIAGAMAMAGLPQAYSPGASMVALGGGTYQGESAVALGVSAVSDNGKWVAKLSGTTNSQGDVGAAVGVGYQW
ncbi:YadA-like family protein, partial [Citrobacter amalonaticus]|uniref:YadA-like family protein n=1 Tax=Citrobacter amalonaticus TaxID=35703 RepID=UPI00300C5941